MEPEAKRYESRYPNGNLCYEEFFLYSKKEDRRHGVSKCWYDNGQLCNEMNYVMGELNGECKGWNLDGTLRFSKVYKEGLEVSKEKI